MPYGGWSVDASVTIPHWDRQGLEHLVRYCARPPLSQERLGRLNDQTLVYSLRRPTADGRTELLLVRIYECLPLRCPKCGEPMRIIAFVLDRPTIERILDHIGEPTQPLRVLPARSPPQLSFGFDQTAAGTDWPEMDQTAEAGGGRLGVIPDQARYEWCDAGGSVVVGSVCAARTPFRRVRGAIRVARRDRGWIGAG